MRFRSAYFICIAATFVIAVGRANGGEPRVFGVSPRVLPTVRKQLAAGDKRVRPAFKVLLKEADAALRVEPVPITEKTMAPASGDKHDYFSIGPYWWPDSSKPDGLPYIRKDGQHNPERFKPQYDRPRLNLVGENSKTLGLAYYFTGKQSYADHAARLLRVFFLDAATRMNPNLNHAQAIPGITTGRGIGMIESTVLTDVADAVALLEGSAAWTAADQKAMTVWFNEFLDWALTSNNGKEEREAKNNHGTFYDVQVVHLALHLGRTNLAREIIEGARLKRLDRQLEPDGSQPLELAREDSFGYSRANLRGYFVLATLGEHVGVDLWRYQTADGAGIRKALEFLLPYLEQPRKSWPYERSRKPEFARLGSLLPQACSVYRDKRYVRALRACSDYKEWREFLWYSIE